MSQPCPISPIDAVCPTCEDGLHIIPWQGLLAYLQGSVVPDQFSSHEHAMQVSSLQEPKLCPPANAAFQTASMATQHAQATLTDPRAARALVVHSLAPAPALDTWPVAKHSWHLLALLHKRLQPQPPCLHQLRQLPCLHLFHLQHHAAPSMDNVVA